MEEKSAPEAATEEVLVSWEAHDRPYKKRGIRFYFNIALIGVVIFLVLFFFQEKVLIAVLFSIIFVGIVFATVPPTTITYQITSKGVRFGKYLYEWEKLISFWPDRYLDHPVYYITTKLPIQKRLILLIDPAKQSEIEQQLNKHLEVIEPPKPTWFDKRAQDMVKLVNMGQT